MQIVCVKNKSSSSLRAKVLTSIAIAIQLLLSILGGIKCRLDENKISERPGADQNGDVEVISVV